MTVTTVPYGPLGSNMYIISLRDGYLIVDPSVSPDYAISKSKLPDSLRSEVLAVLMTHGHYDHTACLDEWAEFTDKIYISSDEAKVLNEPLNNCSYLFDKPLKFSSKTIDLPDELTISDADIKVLRTPGHTPGSVCFFFEKEKVLFTGDTLFAGSVGRSDLPLGDYGDLMSSLKSLVTLPDETICYPGHGFRTSIRTEKERNPYL